MNDTFDKLGIMPTLTAALSKAGISAPTDIQAQVIPLVLAGKELVGQSATGTGKTLAYLLPILQQLDTAERKTQALVLAPTHELAIQIQRQIELLAANSALPVISQPIIGDVNIARQIEKLKDKPHIIVGSAGRILELIQKKKINAQTVKTIVLDEADRLLDDKNIEAIKAVVKTTLRDRQLLFFSATIPAATLAKIKELTPAPEIVRITAKVQVAPEIGHFYFKADQRDKIETLRKAVYHLKVKRALVFINKSDDVETTVAKLNYHGLKAAGLHGTFVKNERKKALEDFRSGRIDLLVASDVAARGLDITDVDYVFNLDLPEEAQVYLHRVGRTGRAGKKGTAISIVAPWEIEQLQRYEQMFKIQIAAKQMSHGKVFDTKKR